MLKKIQFSTEDRISELAETKTASRSTIKTKVDELSEDELKAIIANVDELTEPTEDDLVIKEPAVSAILELAGVEEMESEEYVTRHNFPIIFLFSLGLATLIFFILVNLGLISQD